MAEPPVTIVVVPRERFSYTRQSLESIYENTKQPFSLVYVDGNSPPKIRRYLEAQAHLRGFELIRCDRYLFPNQARNLGLSRVKSQYVVFIDNDVQVAPGWLEPLVQCAQETEATVVCPLVCIGQPLHSQVCLAGGKARIVLEVRGENFRRRVRKKHYFVNQPVKEVQEQLQQQQCEFAKFHCLLVRRDIFNKISSLDEKLFNACENIDFCLSIIQAGGTIYCEPKSVVTYVTGLPLQRSDVFFFRLRWNDDLELCSLRHFRQKWNLAEDQYFEKRYRRLGQRRHQAFLRPLVRCLSLGQPNPRLEKMLVPVERMVNYYITNHSVRQHKEQKARQDFRFQGLGTKLSP